MTFNAHDVSFLCVWQLQSRLLLGSNNSLTKGIETTATAHLIFIDLPPHHDG